MPYSLLIFGLVSAASAVVFETIDFPLGAMIGPIFAVGILAYLTRESPEPGIDATDFAIMLIGIVLGSQVTPEVLNHAEKWPMSMLLLLLTMVLILFTLGRLNQQLLGMGKVSAHLAGAPGNLATAVAIAHQLDGSISQVAIYHSLRLAFLTVITPLIFYVPEAHNAPRAFGSSDFMIWILLLAFAWSMTQALKKLRVTTPGLFAGTIVTALINLSEIAPVNPPSFFISIAMIIFGWQIAIDVLKQGLLILSKTIAPAICANVLAIILAAIGAYITHLTIDLPLSDTLLAFMPGGFQVMPVVALETGADGLYVTTHHLVRVLAMGMLIPLFAYFWRRS